MPTCRAGLFAAIASLALVVSLASCGSSSDSRTSSTIDRSTVQGGSGAKASPPTTSAPSGGGGSSGPPKTRDVSFSITDNDGNSATVTESIGEPQSVDSLDPEVQNGLGGCPAVDPKARVVEVNAETRLTSSIAATVGVFYAEDSQTLFDSGNGPECPSGTSSGLRNYRNLARGDVKGLTYWVIVPSGLTPNDPTGADVPGRVLGLPQIVLPRSAVGMPPAAFKLWGERVVNCTHQTVTLNAGPVIWIAGHQPAYDDGPGSTKKCPVVGPEAKALR